MCILCLKSAVYLRPVWYTASRSRTVTRRPVAVRARSMPGHVYRMANHSLAGPRDVWEHPVFDRVMLGTVRRIMGHTKLKAQLIGEGLPVFLA
jgi:hypothetical protein